MVLEVPIIEDPLYMHTYNLQPCDYGLCTPSPPEHLSATADDKDIPHSLLNVYSSDVIVTYFASIKKECNLCTYTMYCSHLIIAQFICNDKVSNTCFSIA